MVEDLFCALSKERGAGCVGRAESGGEHGELGEVVEPGERLPGVRGGEDAVAFGAGEEEAEGGEGGRGVARAKGKDQ